MMHFVSTVQRGFSFRRARAFVRTFPIAALLFLFCAAPGLAQQEAGLPSEGQLLVDVMPQFITTFRERSWVPVDVLVSNNKQDISGALELTLMNNEDPRSPVYRLPVESPKGSRKRFRMYCNFSKATSMSVMLYNGKRPALPDPVRLTLRPIDSNDVLALILDDEPADYGFVFNAVQLMSPGLGYHREGLHTGQMSQLPEYPQCYDPFTMVVFGHIDPQEVPERQRELLLRYVEHGGIVVFCVGENAARLKVPWVEELAGVSIGEVAASDEMEFARRIFSADLAQGAREGKSIVYARVTPSAGSFVQDLGGTASGADAVLATIRPIGSGHVATIAVDAAGKALQGAAGFTDLWRNLIELREETAEPHYDFASMQAANTLPSATGIRVYPRSSVLIYLGLYFAIGIVGNWIFWSLLKRREMAWVCLVFISFGFTAYALVYGTAGRAKATEIAQLEVLRLPIESPTAKLRSTVGIVAARSSRYNLTFPNAFPLVSDIDTRNMYMGMPQRDSLLGRINTFQFVQGPNATATNFSVGASEMRIIQVESEIASPGKIEGTLTWDGNGIHGELTNNTGLVVRSPFLLVNGKRSTLRAENNRWIVDVPNAVVTARNPLSDVSGRYMNMGYYGGGLIDKGQLQNQFIEDLFASERSLAFSDERVGPYLCGWVDRQPFRNVDLGEPASERIFATLLVADVTIERAEGAGIRNVELDVGVSLANRGGQYGPGYYGGAALSYTVTAGSPLPVTITVPRNFLARPEGSIVVDVYASDEGGGGDVVFLPKDAEESWPDVHRGESVDEGSRGQNVRITSFTLDDWAARIGGDRQQIEGAIAIKGDGIRQGVARVDVRARLLAPQTQSYGGVWKPWQS